VARRLGGLEVKEQPETIAVAYAISRPLARTKEMLDYAAFGAVQNLDVSYDHNSDEVTYYFKPDDTDRALFEDFQSVDEIWITTLGVSGGVH
jgi:hypothetical protein